MNIIKYRNNALRCVKTTVGVYWSQNTNKCMDFFQICYLLLSFEDIIFYNALGCVKTTVGV